MKSVLALSASVFCIASIGTAAEPTPVSVQGGTVRLMPANTQISFVGEHEGPKPDPRKGGFSQFAGMAKVGSNGALEAVGFDIETSSLWSEAPKLTNHLKSPDFFDVRQHPKASFRSTSIAPSDRPGYVNVIGDFTLLGTTKQVRLPAAVAMSSEGMTLVSSFEIDRTQFGMNYGQGKVKKGVKISVVIGEPTQN